ncbi:hydroxyacid dehydrogenase [Candidatus Woesearchaeota archaeon]|nr:MAG: hydroxyacid dehydrogenase [Candidatus Woesearchaeota archaeon]
MHIVITEPDIYSTKSIEKLRDLGEVTLLHPSKKEVLQHIESANVLLIGLQLFVDEEIIEKGKKLKIIGTSTTGTDHIDIKKAEQQNISIVSLKGDLQILEQIDATAEHTIALMLALFRKLPDAYASVKEYRWERKLFVGHELKNKTLGILGFGRLGKKVAALGKAFGMKVMVHDKKQVTKEYSSVSKNELFQTADIVSVHVSLEDDTVHLVSTKEFSLMKRGSWLINTSRGKIVDDDALLDALNSGKLAGAAVDVLSTENTPGHPKNNKLIAYARSHNNLIITPHIGGSTFESLDLTSSYLVEKIKKHLHQQ